MPDEPDLSPKLTAALAGSMLVLLPSVALFYGLDWINGRPMVGLPVLAIFGLMILIGSLSLTSTVFHQLGLSSRTEALALPTGSIRAAIALALVVLFATISIMLFQKLAAPNGEPYWIENLSESELTNVEKQNADRLVVAVPMACAAKPARAASSAGGSALGDASNQTPAPSCYRAQFIPSVSKDAVDIAKQLLTLVGTLMTSLTSFYFANASTRSAGKDKQGQPQDQTPEPDAAPDEASGAQDTQMTADGDGCGMTVSEPTRDEDLPAATGGVA